MALSTDSAPLTTFRWGEQPHSVGKSDQTLLVAARREVVMCEGVQQQVRRAHDEIGETASLFATSSATR
jgi:hypothetical protein